MEPINVTDDMAIVVAGLSKLLVGELVAAAIEVHHNHQAANAVAACAVGRGEMDTSGESLEGGGSDSRTGTGTGAGTGAGAGAGAAFVYGIAAMLVNAPLVRLLMSAEVAAVTCRIPVGVSPSSAIRYKFPGTDRIVHEAK